MDFILRPWQTYDAKSLAASANDYRIASNLRNAFPHPYTIEDAEWFIADCVRRDGDGCLMRAIEIDGRAVGSVSVSVMSDVYEKSAELGYWLAEEYWGLGVMTAAVAEICREAFKTFDIVRIFAEPFAYNEGSRQVLEKNGFTLEGIMRNGIYKFGNLCDYCIYSILKEEIR